mmetsp:Transcript_76760/g.238325  ORF Transcript_76760/g.238325 Transcript_76760/m.238325 type:complete len:285 (-) Transcript_76760:367-1221(-)
MGGMQSLREGNDLELWSKSCQSRIHRTYKKFQPTSGCLLPPIGSSLPLRSPGAEPHRQRLPLRCLLAKSCLALLLLLGVGHIPIEDKVIVKLLPLEKFFEDHPRKGVVRAILKAEALAVVHVGAKLARQVLHQGLHRRVQLLLHDLPVLLLLGVPLKALPRQAPAAEVQQHVADGLEIVAAALLQAQVGADADVAGCPGQVFVLPVRNVLLGAGIPVLLREPKVNYVQLLLLLPDAHQEVVRLDVAVQETLCMHVLDETDHLLSKHQHCFEAEFPPAIVEEILQ